MRKRQGGISKLEFVVVALLFAVFVGIFLNRVRYEQEQAEKLAVDITVMRIRTGLLGEIAERLIKGGSQDVRELVGANPVRWLQSPPPGYLGEFKEVNEVSLQKGSWYFDQATQELVYRVNIAANFRRLDGSGRQEIRWRVQSRGEGKKDILLEELALVPRVAYEWF